MGTSVSSAAMARIRTFAAAAAAFLLALGLAPMAAFGFESVAGPLAGPGYEGDAQSASPNSSPEGPTLASTLAGTSASIVSADVALDAANPIVGSFTADGLTYAINDGKATLVSVSFDLQQVTDSQDAEDSRVAPMLASGQVAIPATVAYNGVTYPVTAIGPYAFYLSGATSVELPDTIASVDDRTFRSSDVAHVTVDPANPNIASYDGALYSADLSSLLLIPEGRAGSVPIPSEAEVVEASKFSHCSLVDAISVDGDGADFASWEGLLYDASGTTLLRVPAGATEITIRDGCITIAAGALEGCANLERINAPASVTSISPDVLTSIPTVALPAASVSGSSQQVTGSQDADDSRVAPMLASGQPDDPTGAEGEAEVSPRRVVASSQGLEAPLALPDLGSTSASPSAAAQLTAMVALFSIDDDLPEVDLSAVEVTLSDDADVAPWLAAGFSAATGAGGKESEVTSTEEASSGQALTSEAYSAEENVGAVTVMGPHWRNDGGNSTPPTIRVSSTTTYSGTYSACGGIVIWASWLTSSDVPYFYIHVGKSSTDTSALNVSDVANQIGYPVFFCYDCDRIIDRRHMPPEGMQRGHQHHDEVSGALGSFSFDWSTYYCWVPNGGKWDGLDGEQATKAKRTPTSNIRGSMTVSGTPDGSLPTRAGYKLIGWNTEEDGSGQSYGVNATVSSSVPLNLYAQWQPCEISFDTDSEPDDADYPGVGKDPISAPDAVGPDGTIPIEDPKRPGYVFEGWVIPTEDGMEAIDQELVYQDERDGKWYVDASKLPDYAGDDGRVELTARWTAALSVDAPILATFMYDLSAWDGGQSRDAYVEGSSTVKNRSAVPIRVSGIESAAGDAAGVLKRGDGTTPADAPKGDAAKVLSVFPTTSAATGTEGDAKAPASDDAADDLAHKVDMALSDVKLEAAFDKGAWAVDAATVGDNGVTVSTGDLKLGYRLNLGSATGVTLDQDALLAVTGDPDAGAAKDAAIANLTYCFAAEGLIPTGTKSDPLWVEVTDPEVGSVGVYGLSDIKRAADDFSSRVDPATDPNDQDAIYTQLAASPYFELFRQLLEHDVSFQVKVDGRYLPLQLLGIAQDTKTADGKRAGLTFQMRDVYAFDSVRSDDAGLGTFDCRMNLSDGNSGGWGSSALRRTLQSTFWGYLPTEVQNAIVGVDKCQQLHHTEADPVTKTTLQVTADETVWLPSMHEVFGTTFASWNDSEALPANGNTPFQYMAYQGNAGSATNAKAIKAYNGLAPGWWLRSASQSGPYSFCGVDSYGGRGGSYASAALAVVPCFCL